MEESPKCRWLRQVLFEKRMTVQQRSDASVMASLFDRELVQCRPVTLREKAAVIRCANAGLVCFRGTDSSQQEKQFDNVKRLALDSFSTA